jgi:hypothetical protein
LFQEYQRLMFDDAVPDVSILAIARPLAKFMGDLPEYATLTKRLSPTAQKVRSAFTLAKSPQKLLFEDLPSACGLVGLPEGDSADERLRLFTDRLRQALRELKAAFPALLTHFRSLMARSFHLDRITDLSELRVVLRGRLQGLDSYTIDTDGLRAFIRRLIKDTGSDDEWLANVLLFLGQKPAKKWNDADVESAEYRLTEFARRIHDLDKLRVHYDGQRHAADPDFDVMLLKSVRRNGAEYEQVVRIDPAARAATKTLREEISQQVRNLPDASLRYALLAELTEELLQERTKDRGDIGREEDRHPIRRTSIGGEHD